MNQTWQEFEYIVIDGGSTDGSAVYIESQKDKFDYWVSEPDKGIYNAMNKGIKVATGEYLLFLNSGDHFFSTVVLEENHQYLKDYDLVCFDIEVLDFNFSKIVSYPKKLSFLFFYLDTLCHQSTVIKKALFDRVGLYDENLKIVSDWKFFMIALFKFNCSYLNVKETLTKFYLDGLSSDLKNKKQFIQEKEMVLNTDFDGFVEDYKKFMDLEKKITNLRNSKKIKILVKFGFLNKF